MNTPRKVYYIAFDKYMQDSQGFQYEVGKTFKNKGYGFCCYNDIMGLLPEFPIKNHPRFFEVHIGKKYNTDEYKTMTKEITIVREIVGRELGESLSGVYTEYYNSGKIKTEKIYKNGELHHDDKPAEICYDETGKIKSHDFYKNGELVPKKIYYKAFNKNLQDSQGKQYEIGGKYTYEGEIKDDKCGFRCCKNILGCLEYYSIENNPRFCEVTIGANSIFNYDIITRQLVIVREIVGEELNSMLSGVCIKYKNNIMQSQKYYKDGKLHSYNDQPAEKYYNDDTLYRWYKNGVLHRDGDKPAVEYYYEYGFAEYWYKDGQQHRDNGKPAEKSYCGLFTRKKWYENGKKCSFKLSLKYRIREFIPKFLR